MANATTDLPLSEQRTATRRVAVAPFLSVSYLLSRCGGTLLLQLTEVAAVTIVLVVFARLLGAEAFGQYSYAMTVVMVLAMFARLGFDGCSVRFVAQYTVRQEPALLRGFLKYSRRTVLLVSLVVMSLFVAVVMLLRDRMPADMTYCLLAAAPLIPCLSRIYVQGAALRGFHRTVLAQLPQGAVVPLALLGIGACAWILKSDEVLTPAWLCVGIHVLAVACGVLFSMYLLKRTVPDETRGVAPVFESRVWLKTATFLALLGGLTKLNAEIDTLMLGVIQDTTQAGLYAVVTRIAGIPVLIHLATSNVIAPALAGHAQLRQTPDMQRLLRYGVLLAVAASFPVVVVLGFGGRQILALVQPEFVAGYAPLLLLLVGNMIYNVFGPVGVLLNMAGHEWDTVRVFAATLALNVACNLLLIPTYGVLGASIGTVASMVACQALLAWQVWHRLRVRCAPVQLLNWVSAPGRRNA